MIRATSARRAPWYVVPADHKWFARLIVGRAILEALEDLDLNYPNSRRRYRGASKDCAVLEAEGCGDQTQARSGFPRGNSADNNDSKQQHLHGLPQTTDHVDRLVQSRPGIEPLSHCLIETA